MFLDTLLADAMLAALTWPAAQLNADVTAQSDARFFIKFCAETATPQGECWRMLAALAKW